MNPYSHDEREDVGPSELEAMGAELTSLRAQRMGPALHRALESHSVATRLVLNARAQLKLERLRGSPLTPYLMALSMAEDALWNASTSVWMQYAQHLEQGILRKGSGAEEPFLIRPQAGAGEEGAP
jgi:hypothetical protein